MVYKHIITGTLIDVPVEIVGGCWQPVKSDKPAQPAQHYPKTEKKTEKEKK